jgi:hypothetical protein
MSAMTGTVVIIVVLVIVIPVAVLITGGIGAALLGGLVNNDNDQKNKGSELYSLQYPQESD